MAFYWKFTRSGDFSDTYVSFIIDAPPDVIDREQKIWCTSFEEIEMFLVLLHDVETCNRPGLGPATPDFKKVVCSIGYEPSSEYKEMRHEMGLVQGQAAMGRHAGRMLDWGYCNNPTTRIDVDVSGFRHAGYIDAKSGKRSRDPEDKLSCFRGDPNFIPSGKYYDLMPIHEVMRPLANYLLAQDPDRANKFFVNVLKWSKR